MGFQWNRSFDDPNYFEWTSWNKLMQSLKLKK
jgi:hypothetical protein